MHNRARDSGCHQDALLGVAKQKVLSLPWSHPPAACWEWMKPFSGAGYTQLLRGFRLWLVMSWAEA